MLCTWAAEIYATRSVKPAALWNGRRRMGRVVPDAPGIVPSGEGQAGAWQDAPCPGQSVIAGALDGDRDDGGVDHGGGESTLIGLCFALQAVADSLERRTRALQGALESDRGRTC